jgi:tubulin polyglutamylase TTLL4
MEVNVCASLSGSSPLDKKIKYSLISDICNLVGFMPNNQSKNAIKEK